jgi:formylglycine-generating enzyme required for sulfatase activity
MKLLTKITGVLMLTATLTFTACFLFDDDDRPRRRLSVGDKETITVGSLTANMIYANDQASITFPFSPNYQDPVNNNKATLTKKFFMSETQVTNALFARVMQWAYNNNKFSTTAGDPNGLDSATVKYGGQQLLNLNNTNIKINYSEGSFTVDSGFANHPVVCVTWYGAIMFCNWLTEMRDGNTDNVVYTGIDTTWEHTETVENADRNGYRLPSSEEWEYAARYIGTKAPTEGDLASQYLALDHGGHAELTQGYCWTPGAYASGAIKNTSDEPATRAVAWYRDDPDMQGNQLMPIKQKTPNQLGLYDMSGNVWEWCFTEFVTGSGSNRVWRGGGWYSFAVTMQVGFWNYNNPYHEDYTVGFRFARTK